MHPLIEQSRKIKDAADRILHDDGLEEILCNYGEVHYVGSYEIDLMLKKDIDISLINPSLTLKEFHQLAFEASSLLHPHSMHFRDTRVKPIQYRPPHALYWAFEFADWNIDLWLVEKEYYLESVDYMNRVKQSLDDLKKITILDIKNRALNSGQYGRTFGSREIYQAVLQDGINSSEEFCGFSERQGI